MMYRSSFDAPRATRRPPSVRAIPAPWSRGSLRSACATLLAGALLVMLTACGGGGGGSDDEEPEVPAGPPPIADPQPLEVDADNDGTLDPVGTPGMLGPVNGWVSNPNPPAIPGPDGTSLVCGEMDETYHIHTHLSIFLDGQLLATPRSIGLIIRSNDGSTPDCWYPVHTHAQNGLIHVEAPDAIPTNLGQFFEIWGRELSRTEVAGIADGKPIVFYIRDGDEVVEYDGDPAEIEFADHREITIQIGEPIEEIPNYTW
jgi:hypothetical protein